ncbi:MAG: GNAT family N-acetyltransferase [Oscillospiraceae bacterium]|nr:GNAT family N-acetyltransferase [Oscillospiraceae bacterium]
MLFLKEANLQDAEQEYLLFRDIPADENGFVNEWPGVSREEFEAMVLPAMIAHGKGEGLPAGYVPESWLFLWDDEKITGLFRLRHHLCDSLREGAGHIGYFVHPRHRGRGYASEGLRLALQIAADIIPEDEIYLRVSKDNPASLQVMLKNGGYIHHEDEEKFYVRFRKPLCR